MSRTFLIVVLLLIIMNHSINHFSFLEVYMSKLYIYAGHNNICINLASFLSIYFQNVPPDLSVCAFVLAQCLSVRALQEMLASREDPTAGVRVSLHSPFILFSSILFSFPYSFLLSSLFPYLNSPSHLSSPLLCV